MNRATRADDEQVLVLLAARLEMSSGDVGAQFGRSSEYVRTATNRVRDADLAASLDEPAEIVAAYYDWKVS